jgi:small GTP-binding protein
LIEKPSKTRLKICIVGEKAVGKTSLLNRYVFGTFGPDPENASGTRMSLCNSRQVEAGGKVVDVDVALFDLMGATAVRDSFKDVLFWGAHGFLAVADVTRPETIRTLPAWVKIVRAVAGEIPFQVLLNKVDLASTRELNPEDESWIQSRFPRTRYHLVSAKSSIGVEDGIDALVATVMVSIIEKAAVKKETVLQVGDIGRRILSFAKRRSPIGVAKKDLLMVIKNIDHDSLMAEIEELRKNGFVMIELTGPASFLVKITEKGEKQLEQTVAH